MLPIAFRTRRNEKEQDDKEVDDNYENYTKRADDDCQKKNTEADEDLEKGLHGSKGLRAKE